MKRYFYCFYFCIITLSLTSAAQALKTRDISHLISKEEFLLYQDVADFIDKSPQVTVVLPPKEEDKDEHGQVILTSLTGSDCDRDGKMDSNATCNAVFYKLWLKYAR